MVNELASVSPASSCHCGSPKAEDTTPPKNKIGTKLKVCMQVDGKDSIVGE